MSGSIIEFTDDLANAEAPEPIPAGTYTAEIVKAEAKVSQTSGNTYASVTFRINADDYPADFANGDPDGTSLSYNRLLLENTIQARYRLKKFCESVGAPMGRTVDLNDWLGLTATVEVAQTVYEGEKRAEIKRVVAG